MTVEVADAGVSAEAQDFLAFADTLIAGVVVRRQRERFAQQLARFSDGQGLLCCPDCGRALPALLVLADRPRCLFCLGCISQ